MWALEVKWGHEISPNWILIELSHMQLVSLYDKFVMYQQEFPSKFYIFVVHRNAIKGIYNQIQYPMNQTGTGHFRKQTHLVHTSCMCFIFCINSWNPLAASIFIFYKQTMLQPELSYCVVSRNFIVWSLFVGPDLYKVTAEFDFSFRETAHDWCTWTKEWFCGRVEFWVLEYQHKWTLEPVLVHVYLSSLDINVHAQQLKHHIIIYDLLYQLRMHCWAELRLVYR